MESGIERVLGGIASIKGKAGDCPKAEMPTYQHLPAEDHYSILGFPERGYLLNRQVVVRTVGL